MRHIVLFSFHELRHQGDFLYSCIDLYLFIGNKHRTNFYLFFLFLFFYVIIVFDLLIGHSSIYLVHSFCIRSSMYLRFPEILLHVFYGTKIFKCYSRELCTICLFTAKVWPSIFSIASQLQPITVLA